MSRVLTLEEFQRLRPTLDGVVFVGGVFDLLHVGHVEHLEEAKALGQTLVVHVTSDKRVKAKKGPDRPVHPEQDRACVVAALKPVDYVFIADQPHYYREIVEAVRPDILVLNEEAVSDEVRDRLSKLEGLTKVHITDSNKVRSTSQIIDNLTQVRS